MECKDDTIYFINVGTKEKLKKSEIEDKLGLSTFDRLHYTFDYLHYLQLFDTKQSQQTGNRNDTTSALFKPLSAVYP